jgi:hypothetical protein
MASDVLKRAAASSARSRWLAAVMAIAIPSLVNVGILLHRYDGQTYLRGDCPYYYYTAQSLLKGFGFDLSLLLPGGWTKHLDQIARSVSQHLVPKHPVTMPVISLPFIAAFGKPGALAFNVVQVTLLLWILYAMAVRIARPWAASVAVILTYVASFLPHYLWNYSPDICATALLAGGVLALLRAERSWMLWAAGLLLGAACTAKYPYVLFLPGVLLLVPHLSWRRVMILAAGIAVPLLALLTLDWHLFGSPFVTGYDRILTLDRESRPIVYSQRASFVLPLRDGVIGQLLDRSHGLVYTSPITLISLIGFWPLLRRAPRLALYLASGSLVLFLLFSTYDQWAASHYGNRFLMPIVALAAVPLAAGLERAAAWRDARRRPPAGAGSR